MVRVIDCRSDVRALLRNMSEKPENLLTATQAAQAAGVSRWAIHRAIKSLSLKAVRDNRNVWRIASDDLASWCATTVAQPLRAQDAAQAGEAAEVAILRELLAATERARDQAETDRDHWRTMAEKLAARRRWWPFR